MNLNIAFANNLKLFLIVSLSDIVGQHSISLIKYFLHISSLSMQHPKSILNKI